MKINHETGKGDMECPLCGGSSNIVENDLPGYFESQKFAIWHCLKCDASFSLPRIAETGYIYNLIYSNIDGIQNYYRYRHYAECVLAEPDPLDYLCRHEQSYWGIRKALFDILSVGTETKIIELGCGLGYLTYSLNRAGLNVRGVDISETAIKNATERFGNYYSCKSLSDLSSAESGSFDIVIMTELLEHLYDIKAFMEEVVKLINKRGKIILTTPDKTPFNKVSSWCTDLPPVHTWWLSEKSVKQIGLNVGMKTRFVRFNDFYRNRPEITDLLAISAEKPTFSKNGNLINKRSEIIESNKKRYLTGRLRRMTGDRLYFFLKKIYYSMKPQYVVFGKRGFSICAILYFERI